MRRFWFLSLVLFALPAAAGGVEDILKVYDQNGDGVLDKDEVPDAGLFNRFDQNKDGKITATELAKSLGLPKPEPAPAPEKKAPPKKPDAKQTEASMKTPRTIRERTNAFFTRFDANKDDKVQKAEFPAADRVFAGRDQVYEAYDKSGDEALSRREAKRYITALVRAQKARPRPDNFFDLFDVNRDDKVTRAEYKGGPRAFFRMYDHNRNGAVTREEMNMGPNQNRSERAMESDEKFMADGPTQMPKLTMLDRYDKDKDGRITLKELDGAESVLHRFDRNGDGVLSGGECR